MHTYAASFPISPLRDLKHLGTLLRTNLILVLQWGRYTGWAILQCQNAPGVPMKTLKQSRSIIRICMHTRYFFLFQDTLMIQNFLT